MDKRLVKIKTWEQMEQEFGLDVRNNIYCKYGFSNAMENIMPKNRIIILEYDTWDGWGISDDMIEEELNPKDYPQYFI